MRNVFIAAKYFAIEENSDKIQKKHLMKAFSSLNIVDEDVVKFLKKEYSFEKNVNEEHINKTELQQAKEHDKISFSDEVKDIKNNLEQNGFGLNMHISEFIKNPSEKLEFFEYISNIKEKLSSKIYSQDIAIEAITDNLTQVHYKQNGNTPKGIFFFLGPPATGKTYLAKLLSDIIGGYEMRVFDMSAYQGSNQNFALMGLSKGYSNAKEGDLSSFVKKNPKSICVFDEIEKSHPEVQNIFLSIMSSGKALDEFTQKEVDFTQSIFIFTSNLGSELYSNKSFLKNLRKDYDAAQSIILEAIGREKYETSNGGYIPVLKPEFISRLSQGDVILFNKLSFDSLVKIATTSLNDTFNAFNDTFSLNIHSKDMDNLAKISVLNFAPMIDVRRIKSKLPIKTMDIVTDFLQREKPKNVKRIEIVLDESIIKFLQKHITHDEKKDDEFIHELFRKNKTINVVHTISLNDDIITLTYSDAKIEKLPKSRDFLAENGGLIVDVPEISFEQIAGHKKVKTRLLEIIDLLKNPQKMKTFDVKISKGMLLFGEPGTGKTMLAKAFANKADLPFISTTGTQMLDIDTMRNVFKRAREYAPSIIFIDEIDAVGYRDGSGKDIVINQFLTELNGFDDDKTESVFVIAATNFKQKIDPALLRSGRIDLHVKVGMLDKEAREYFINNILKKPNDGNIDKDKLVTFSAGMSGADLEKVSREASYEVIRSNKNSLTEEILLEQINIIKYGERLTQKSLQKHLHATAYHEAGHALISHILMPQIKIEQITVTPRKEALGFVSYNNEDNLNNLSYEDIKSRICIAFAGRIAQMEFEGNDGLDSGASSDLNTATRLAFYAIANLGMESEIGYINLESFPKILENGYISQKIQQKVHKLLSDQKSRCQDLVRKEWGKIEKLAKILINKEFVDEDEFLEIVG